MPHICVGQMKAMKCYRATVGNVIDPVGIHNGEQSIFLWRENLGKDPVDVINTLFTRQMHQSTPTNIRIGSKNGECKFRLASDSYGTNYTIKLKIKYFFFYFINSLENPQGEVVV